MLEAIGPGNRMVWGKEAYRLRTLEDFRRSFDWAKGWIANCTDGALNPAELRAKFNAQVLIAASLANYGSSFREGWLPEAESLRFGMSADIFEATARFGLQTHDCAWVYLEDDRTGNQPSDRAANNTPTGTSGNWLAPNAADLEFIARLRKARGL